MSDSNGVHGGHGVFGTGERVEVHANVSGDRGKLVPCFGVGQWAVSHTI